MARTRRIDPAPAPEPVQEPTTALALPDTPILVQAFSAPEKMEALLTRDALSAAEAVMAGRIPHVKVEM
jgi:hypothetical protein